MGRATLLLVPLVVVLACANALPTAGPTSRLGDEDSWRCVVNQSDVTIAPGLTWRSVVCNSTYDPVPLPIGPLLFNIVQVDLTQPGLRVRPVVANYSATGHVQNLQEMAAENPSFLAGINGGFFWELNSASFVDDVCLGKVAIERLFGYAQKVARRGRTPCSLSRRRTRSWEQATHW